MELWVSNLGPIYRVQWSLHVSAPVGPFIVISRGICRMAVVIVGANRSAYAHPYPEPQKVAFGFFYTSIWGLVAINLLRFAGCYRRPHLVFTSFGVVQSTARLGRCPERRQQGSGLRFGVLVSGLGGNSQYCPITDPKTINQRLDAEANTPTPQHPKTLRP